MIQYELMVMLNPDLGSEAIKKRLDEVRKLVTSQKGEIFYEDLWGLRDLAYRIKQHDRGYYAVFDFTLDPAEGDLKEIDTTCRLEHEILRHMMVKLPANYEPKSFAVVEEEEEEKKPARKAAPKKAAAAKSVKKKEEKPTEEPKEDKEPKETKKKEKAPEEDAKEPSLEDVDAKLKSIIENPDLNF